MISREQIVVQSVESYVRDLLDSKGYTAAKVELIDSFDGIRGRKLDKTYVAAGFNFDTGGEGAEMGSDLTRRQYTIEFFIFGQTLTWARNVSSVLKFGLQAEGTDTLPLLNLETGAVVDYLEVDGATTERQPIPEPEPWQEFVYTCHLKVTDTYYASLVA